MESWPKETRKKLHIIKIGSVKNIVYEFCISIAYKMLLINIKFEWSASQQTDKTF